MSHTAPIETDLFRDLLPLVAHCVTNADAHGNPTRPGTLTIGTQGSAWIVEVFDPELSRVIRVTACTLDHALMLAAELLRSEVPPWVKVKGRATPAKNSSALV